MTRARYVSDVDEWLDDDELQRRIVDRIEADPAFWASRGTRKARAAIEVDVEDGYVTLRGTAQSPTARRRADILARALGACGVDNRLQLEREADARAS